MGVEVRRRGDPGDHRVTLGPPLSGVASNAILLVAGVFFDTKARSAHEGTWGLHGNYRWREGFVNRSSRIRRRDDFLRRLGPYQECGGGLEPGRDDGALTYSRGMAVTTVAPIPVAQETGPRKLTIEEFERLPENFFPEGERAELIDGLIYTKMGQNDPHAFALRYSFRVLAGVFGIGFEITVQCPLKLGDGGKPEPDLLVLRGQTEDYEERRVDPPADVELLVEISDSSLAYDRGTKANLYARHGVPEYWIVNLPNRTVEVRRLPRADGYAEIRIYAEGESVSVNGGEVSVADLLPKAV